MRGLDPTAKLSPGVGVLFSLFGSNVAAEEEELRCSIREVSEEHRS